MAKIYIWDGETLTKIPKLLQLEDGTTISPVSEYVFQEAGGIIEDDGTPTHWELLDAACDKFVACCNKIGLLIGDPSFQGGIDEIEKLHAYASTVTDLSLIIQALKLVAEWEGCDKECNHWASKDDVNLPSPAWWWYCWERYAQQQEAEEAEEESAEEPEQPEETEPESEETPEQQESEPGE